MGQIQTPGGNFLWGLWTILATPTYKHAICWHDDHIFTILDKIALERDVLPHHFSSKKYTSFQRQLNYHCFKKVRGLRGGYSHPLFDHKGKSLDNWRRIQSKRREPVLDKVATDHVSQSPLTTTIVFGSAL